MARNDNFTPEAEIVFTEKSFESMQKSDIKLEDIIAILTSKNIGKKGIIPGAITKTIHMPGKTIGALFMESKPGRIIIINCW